MNVSQNKILNKRRKEETRRVKISKTLSYLLRHNKNMKRDSEGFSSIEDILSFPNFQKWNVTEEELLNIVETNEKKRFEIRQTNNNSSENDLKGSPISNSNSKLLFIRASQGHSKAVSDNLADDKMHKPITSYTDVEVCIHGTQRKNWHSIYRKGLSRMERKHIHFCSRQVNSKEIISGVRQTCDLFIYLDLKRALEDGITFWLSSNQVILSEGVESKGVIPRKYFKSVVYKPKEEDNKNNNDKGIEIYPQKQPKYLMILDFEATCDNLERHEMEIIEFPTVTLNTETCEIEGEFHKYVKPEIVPKLSAFCTELTGIEQSVVDKADGFKIVWNEFLVWMKQKGFVLEGKGDDDDMEQKKELASEKNTFLFVTCGDWDLKTMLPKQLKHCSLRNVEIFKKWINVKKLFKKEYGKTCKGMTDLLKHFNLPLVGRHHSGIDDCRNITSACIQMLKDGCHFAATTS